MDTVIDNLARAIRKLAVAGFEHCVLTADHGHLFFPTDRDESMRINMTTFTEERRELLDEMCDEIRHQAIMAMRKAGCSSEEIEQALVRYAAVMRHDGGQSSKSPPGRNVRGPISSAEHRFQRRSR